jgi:hypothetical protein
MKLTTALVLLIAGITRGLPADFYFLPQRYTEILLVTAEGKQHVTVNTYQQETDTEKVVFSSALTEVSRGIFRTPDNVVFTLEHLSKPIINDENHKINSGDWKLTVSGKGDSFAHIKSIFPIDDLGDTPPLVYLGTERNAGEAEKVIEGKP